LSGRGRSTSVRRNSAAGRRRWLLVRRTIQTDFGLSALSVSGATKTEQGNGTSAPASLAIRRRKPGWRRSDSRLGQSLPRLGNFCTRHALTRYLGAIDSAPRAFCHAAASISRRLLGVFPSASQNTVSYLAPSEPWRRTRCAIVVDGAVKRPQLIGEAAQHRRQRRVGGDRIGLHGVTADQAG
jgi:hypothetical protein